MREHEFGRRDHSCSAIWLWAALVFVARCPAQAQSTLYVDDDAPAGGNGRTWPQALRGLQEALTATAASGGTVTEIHVAQGVYKPTSRRDAAPRSVTFQLRSGLALRGGYAGLGQPNPDARDVARYETILSGDLAGDDRPDWGNISENAYHVVIGSGTDGTAILDGFTVTAGNANRQNPPQTGDYGGGGIQIIDGSPTLIACTFRKNASTGYGGAIYNWHASPTLERCTIVRNSAPETNVYCGGMMSSTDSHPRLLGCRFAENYGSSGSAIHTADGCSCVLINCVVTGNSGYDAAIYGQAATLTLTNCVVAANISMRILANLPAGPAGLQAGNGTTSISNSIFWANTDGESQSEAVQVGIFGTQAVLQINYNCVQGWSGALGGVGNAGHDPRFVDMDGLDNVPGTADDDVSLRFGSPCIDAGDNEADTDAGSPGVQALPSTDFLRGVRILDDPETNDTGHGTGSIVDVGAVEGPRARIVLSEDRIDTPKGGTAAVGIRLERDPGQRVVVRVMRVAGTPSIEVRSGGTLFFDASNYSVPQMVTLAAGPDAGFTNDPATIRAAAVGIASADVIVTQLDGDPVPHTIFVNTTAGGANTGLTWTDAFVDLQQALDAAANRPGIVDVWVAAGTYHPSMRKNPLDPRSVTFQLVSDLSLLGGFAGTETRIEERDPEAHVTVLSGDLRGNDVGDPDDPSHGENSYSVVTGSGVDATAVLDGFTITGGCANKIDSQDNDQIGGGVRIYGGSPTIVRCTLVANFAADIGGAICANYESSPIIKNCRFIDNLAGSGGSGGSGGAVFCGAGRPVLTECSFKHNKSTGYYPDGGALAGGGELTVDRCEFIENTATPESGGIDGWAGAISFSHGSIRLTGCFFQGNSAARCGAVSIHMGPTSIMDGCTFVGNQATDDFIARAGAVALYAEGSPIISNCMFSENSAWGGAGLWIAWGDPIITDCIFLENRLVGFDPQGGGALADDAGATFQRCSFFGNRGAGGFGAGLVVGGRAEQWARVVECIFQGNVASQAAGMIANRAVVESCIFSGNTALYDGGLVAGDAVFTNCTFNGNRAVGDPEYGYGRIGGMYLYENVLLRGCVLSGNHATGDIGGVACRDDTRFINCTINYNWAGGTGGGIGAGAPRLTNCILWGNHDVGGSGPSAQITSTAPMVNYCCVQGLDGRWGGVGNVASDPLFLDADGPDDVFGTLDDDVHILPGSVCVNAGTDPIVDLPDTDLDGEPRRQACRVDIGADESPYAGFADCNRDEFDDFCDISSGTSRDCNSNFNPDECDVAAGESQDTNTNGLPDECELQAIYVNFASTGSNTGTSWTDAYRNLQDALRLAHQHVGISEVWVVAGVYTPAAAGGDRLTSFELAGDVHLLGGFAGGEVAANQRDPDAHLTVLSGDLNGDDGPDFARRGDNSFHVVTTTGSGSMLLDGFTILGGSADDPADREIRGGGLFNFVASPSINHCVFRDNRAGSSGGGMCNRGGSPRLTFCIFTENLSSPSPGAFYDGVGGGMSNDLAATPVMIGCLFARNEASEGGAMYNALSDCTLIDCTFAGNIATGGEPTGGGAIKNVDGGGTELTGCFFAGNWAHDGAGLRNSYAGSAALTACRFTDNTAEYHGGAIDSYSGSALVIANSIFLGNSAYGGGAIYHRSSAITNCIFAGNAATNGAAIWSESDSNKTTITNCVVSANTSTYGGAISGRSSGGPLVITNSILWGNRSEHDSGQAAQISGRTPLATYCCIEGLDTLAGPGNIGGDPLFVNPRGGDGIIGTADDDFRLAGNSPCLDAGDNLADIDAQQPGIQPLPDTDLDGHPRRLDDPDAPDVGNGAAPLVDMGAHEGREPTIRVNPRSLAIPEGGSAVVNVWLDTDPGGSFLVRVYRATGSPALVITSGVLLRFDSTNYRTPQPVTLAAIEEPGFVNATAIVRAGSTRFGRTDVLVTEMDNDPVPARIYVDRRATGQNSGLDWANALVSFAEALDAAHQHLAVTEIWVAAGVYHPAILAGQPMGDPGPRLATFALRSGLALYGGFAGGESGIDQRDPSAHPTILSGDLNDDDNSHDPAGNDCCTPHAAPGCADPQCQTLICEARPECCIGSWDDACVQLAESLPQCGLTDCYALSTLHDDNCFHVVTGSGVEASAVLDGFLITGGNADGAEAPDLLQAGGGLFNFGGSPTIRHCTFADNLAADGGGMYNGSVYQGSPASPLLDNCLFIDNQASRQGAGLCNVGAESNPAVTRCTFQRNRPLSYVNGGGVYNQSAHPVFTDCSFLDNSASGGGAMSNSESRPSATGCTFARNTATSGGALYNRDAGPELTHCVFVGNTARSDGGVMSNIVLTSSNLANQVLVGCTFIGNQAPLGGVIYDRSYTRTAVTTAFLQNCVFSGNASTNRGGCILSTSGAGDVPTTVRVANCSFSENTAPTGAAIYSERSSSSSATDVFVSNSIFWGASTSQIVLQSGTASISYTCLRGGFAGAGNFDADPRFLDPFGPDQIAGTSDDDLHLAIDSPCLEAGDPAFTPNPAAPTDIDGQPRVMGCRVDMGADEFLLGVPGSGDFDNSRRVDWPDVTPFVQQLLGPTRAGLCVADLNSDQTLDGTDIRFFVNRLLAP